MIPREGVESFHLSLQTLDPQHQEVIPREGVESRIAEPRPGMRVYSRVIPREGVESLVDPLDRNNRRK